MPFLVLAFAGARPASSEAAFLTLLLAVLAPAAALGGIARRARREASAQHAARQDIAGALLEHSALGERTRIARELHDIVAHHISMVSVQAETARLTTPGMPAAGARQLTAIGDTARAALTEMRQLLGVLRQDDNGETAERRPQPTLAELAELIDETRDATGAATRLDPARPPGQARPRRRARRLPHRARGPDQRPPIRGGRCRRRRALLQQPDPPPARPRQRPRPLHGPDSAQATD